MVTKTNPMSLREMLLCDACHRTLIKPYTFNCALSARNHTVCDSCITDSYTCPKCKIPSADIPTRNSVIQSLLDERTLSITEKENYTKRQQEVRELQKKQLEELEELMNAKNPEYEYWNIFEEWTDKDILNFKRAQAKYRGEARLKYLSLVSCTYDSIMNIDDPKTILHIMKNLDMVVPLQPTSCWRPDILAAKAKLSLFLT